MKRTTTLMVGLFLAGGIQALEKPNLVLLFADDAFSIPWRRLIRKTS